MNRNSSALLRARMSLLVASVLSLAISSATAQDRGNLPPPAVAVLEVQAQTIPEMTELPGRIAATRTSEVRARVSGILIERVFEQGSFVTEGEVLYRIDPNLFRVRVDSAKAALQRAMATQANARLQLTRQKTLLDRNITSAVDFDSASVAVEQASADVALAQAALDEAEINLGYTEVRAPISGIIGGALVTEGALVTADGSQNLALIQQLDPVYADFTQSVSELLQLKRAVESGELKSPAPGEAHIELVFDNGEVYEHKGRLLFSNARVDASTGQVTLRGEFPNPKGDLLPGMYVRVRVEQAVRHSAILIPQRAVVRSQEGKAQVYVVGSDNTAQLRQVELSRTLNGNWLVESGELAVGDRVIVNGAQKAQPGGQVVPEPWTNTEHQKQDTDPVKAAGLEAR